MVRIEQLARIQLDHISHATVEEIAHGATVPIELINQYCPGPGYFFEIGSAQATKLNELQRVKMCGAFGLEPNIQAAEQAKQLYDIQVYPQTITQFWQQYEHAAVFMELMDGVLLQGVLANAVTPRDQEHIIIGSDIALGPGKYLFIAEPLRIDDLLVQQAAHSEAINSVEQLMEWRDLWVQRYRDNFRSGLPFGVFCVAKPGERKDILDWNQSPDELRLFPETPEFERFATHISYRALVALCKKRDFFPVREPEFTVMFSRKGYPIPGVIAVFQKQHRLKPDGPFVYRYKPAAIGKTPRQYYDEADERSHIRVADPDDWQRILKQTIKAMPKDFRPLRELVF